MGDSHPTIGGTQQEGFRPGSNLQQSEKGMLGLAPTGCTSVLVSLGFVDPPPLPFSMWVPPSCLLTSASSRSKDQPSMVHVGSRAGGKEGSALTFSMSSSVL